MPIRFNQPPRPIPDLENCRATVCRVEVRRLTLWSLLPTLAGIAVAVAGHRLWPALSTLSAPTLLLLWALFMVSIPVHELIHALTFLALTHCGVDRLSFGLQAGVAYCHADAVLPLRHYRVVLVAPLVVLGLVPLVVGLLTHHTFLLSLALLEVGGVVGDMAILWRLRHLAPSTLVYDHPSDAGCVVYHPL